CMPKRKYTPEILEAIPAEELTAGQRTAAIRYGLYPVGYFDNLPCSNCKKKPRHLKKAYCKTCFDEIFYEKYYNDECPECGKPKRNVSPRCRECSYKYNSGENHPLWRGGRRLEKDGYIRVYAPNHPRRGSSKY